MTDRLLFSSPRERTLWMWTGMVAAGIAATLFLSGVVADPALGQTIAALAFGASMILIGVAVVLMALKARPRGLEIGVGVGVAAVYILLLTRMTAPERSHLIEYSVLAALMYEALSERRANGRIVPVPAALAALGATTLGILDEAVQLALPSRVFDTLDILFNGLAALGAILAVIVVRWARTVAASRADDGPGVG